MAELIRYTEPLAADELAFLERRESKDRSQYYKVFQILMLFSFVFPFIGAWYRATDNAPNAFSPARFFLSATILLFISSVAVYVPYRAHLRKIQRDIREGTKTIEVAHIMRKLQMNAKKTCHFYIDSKIKLSIEVSYDDFARLDEGDDVSIEYTTHSRLYLGYF